jgi:hypothetical protein
MIQNSDAKWTYQYSWEGDSLRFGDQNVLLLLLVVLPLLVYFHFSL